jgi:hypothetical protein
MVVQQIGRRLQINAFGNYWQVKPKKAVDSFHAEVCPIPVSSTECRKLAPIRQALKPKPSPVYWWA